MLPMRISKSVVIGMGLAIIVGALAFALEPLFDTVGVYATPGIIFLPLTPSKLVYWLDPHGGPAVGTFLLVLCATLFWTIFFGATHFGWVSFRLRRK
jgi:hypothetical protein